MHMALVCKYSIPYSIAWFKIITAYAVHPSQQGRGCKRNEVQ